jgi:Flp pilus assembly protein TadG
MKKFVFSLIRSHSGAAGAEMALIFPLLVTLMFGAFEVGYYFYNEHILVKSVRDAARFAGRQNALFSNASCTSGAVTAAPAPTIDNVARYGKAIVTVADKTKIYGWTTPVTVRLDCPAIGSYSGIYRGKTSIPIVTVSATNVPYPSLFGTLGFSGATPTLNASSQSAVMGI